MFTSHRFPVPPIFLFGLLALAVGCAPSPDQRPPQSPPSMTASADDGVLEAVFLRELRAAEPKPDEAVCLRVRVAPGNAPADPSDALLAAIRKVYSSAVKGSACRGGGPSPVRVIDGDRPGVVADIGPVVWEGPDAARVEGGGASRGGSTVIREVEYRVERDGSRWRVASERVLRQT